MFVLGLEAYRNISQIATIYVLIKGPRIQCLKANHENAKAIAKQLEVRVHVSLEFSRVAHTVPNIMRLILIAHGSIIV